MKEDPSSCSLSSKCRETPLSWMFLFVGLVATISIRLVNFILDLNIVWAKICWYIGVIGFTVYFIYKFVQYNSLQKELRSNQLMEKLACQDELSAAERGILRNVLCALTAKESVINYFFIFLTSAIALIVGLVQDLIIR